MITPKDLQEAIAYYSGKVDPGPNDAVFLAACQYLEDREILLKNAQAKSDVAAYSFAAGPPEPQRIYSGADTEAIGDYGDSVFLQAVYGKDAAAVWAVMDDLMDTMRVTNKRVYDRVLREIREIER